MRWRLNSCRGHRANVSLLASGMLAEAEQNSVKSHLKQCAPCRQYYEDIARLSGHFQQWASTERPLTVDANFRARWMRSILTAEGTRMSIPTAQTQWKEWLWPSPMAWGALAAVWVCLLFLQGLAATQPVAGHEQAQGSPKSTITTFAQRQQELSSLLESLAPAPPPPEASQNQPRPRSQRQVESTKT